MAGLGDAARLNETVFKREPLDHFTTFFGFYILQSRAAAGDCAGALELARHFYGGMLDLGATTFWEEFNMKWLENASRIDELPQPGKFDVHLNSGPQRCYTGLRHSLCHGWGGGVAAFLSETLLGVQALEPGLKTVRITPQLGDLEYLDGTYPVPGGDAIRVRIARCASGEIERQITVPDTVALLPDHEYAKAGS
ncbi:hypothetical protein SDC9_104274 [bioreactor metagenome]|uniref:Alpha-L-rhamnosidase C-terminal domain-containing protein n=1 Tax=bioreactor metagenome TaxID=1076179 RepID=A0A645AW28_9ZZZZ